MRNSSTLAYSSTSRSHYQHPPHCGRAYGNRLRDGCYPTFKISVGVDAISNNRATVVGNVNGRRKFPTGQVDSKFIG